MLAYLCFEHPFILDVEASADGLGAVLTQEYQVHERVVAYYSKRLNSTEIT